MQLQQDHVVRLETRPPNIEGKGQVTTRDLVRNALRMRPERIIIGECRGAEALDMLQAMNTGHAGSMTTLHANTPRDAQARLETMVMMAGMELPIKAMRQQISSAVDIIIQANRLQGGPRKVTSITEVMNMEQDIIIMQDIFRYKQIGIDQNGRAFGQFEATGRSSQFHGATGSRRHETADELVPGAGIAPRLAGVVLDHCSVESARGLSHDDTLDSLPCSCSWPSRRRWESWPWCCATMATNNPNVSTSW